MITFKYAVGITGDCVLLEMPEVTEINQYEVEYLMECWRELLPVDPKEVPPGVYQENFTILPGDFMSNYHGFFCECEPEVAFSDRVKLKDLP